MTSPFDWKSAPPSKLALELQKSEDYKKRATARMVVPQHTSIADPKVKDRSIARMFSIRQRYDFGA